MGLGLIAAGVGLGALALYEGYKHIPAALAKTGPAPTKPALPSVPPSQAASEEDQTRTCIAANNISPGTVPPFDPQRTPPLANGAGNMGLDVGLAPEVTVATETIVQGTDPTQLDIGKLIHYAFQTCIGGAPIAAAVVMAKVDYLREHGGIPAAKQAAPPLPSPQPLPTMPANPPAIDLGPDFLLFGASGKGSAEEYQVRKALAWEVDPAALGRWVRASNAMGWTTAAALFQKKGMGVIANPQPYAYLQTEYPNYLVNDDQGNPTPITLDTPDEQSTGIAKYFLANELDMGNLANISTWYKNQGLPATAAMFAKKLAAQVSYRNGVGATLPPLVQDGATGVIQPVGIMPMPPLKMVMQATSVSAPPVSTGPRKIRSLLGITSGMSTTSPPRTILVPSNQGPVSVNLTQSSVTKHWTAIFKLPSGQTMVANGATAQAAADSAATTIGLLVH